MPLPSALVFILSCFLLNFCTCTDIISSTQFIKDPETIVSEKGTFKLGFFSPANNTNRYVCVLYNIPVMTPIWVANRAKALNDSLGTVTISEDGNLVVLDGQKAIIWSSNVSSSQPNSSRAQLLDTGNLVLLDNSSGRVLWESFEHPSDSFMQGMRLSTDVNTNENIMLTSWRTPSDPSIGRFSLGLDPLNIPESFIWENSRPRWRSGPWNGQVFIGIASMYSIYRSGLSLADNKEGRTSVTYTFANESVLLYSALTSEGALLEKIWYEGMQDWEVTWSSQMDECDFYGKCGPFGICNSKKSPVCSCLDGFEPTHMEEWSNGNWTSGCMRRTQLQCDRKSTTGEDVKEDGFLKFSRVKVPDFAEWLALRDDCESHCLNNCSCIAYGYFTGIGCMHWSDSLIDIMQFSGNSGPDLYVRVAYSDLGKKKNIKVVVITVVVTVSAAIAIGVYIAWKCMPRKRGRKQKNELLVSKRVKADSENSTEILLGDTMRQVKLEQLEIFHFEEVATATGNFKLDNKLGQGGFGPVYKGKLADGREMAVKMLSRSSGQGLEEFMNEVAVICKLQHRNLVRLLGCSVENGEKMLIYEYLPNGSLDRLLFDPFKQQYLDWSKRVNIIEGIGRGLLYLHRDSRLRIIHRDLKASNILLDKELNPKISDFGMARIFGGDQDHANTRRVVGTYGYMAPEYAMEGIFSEKSDVYSFGVLLLETLSGRKISSFYSDLSLLQLAWKLWNEEKISELIDRRIYDPCIEMEILRFIHVGLLCVQEFAKDRPTVSTVLSMLSSEIADLPTPNQPAFTERKISSEKPSLQQSNQKFSVDNASITLVEGR